MFLNQAQMYPLKIEDTIPRIALAGCDGQLEEYLHTIRLSE
ncbi:hypothetical protein LUCX_58 [Xanthomonas phage vB_XciM_LucasX]|nr:hypothetical protein LUCX_58 [Xanthomonas phage vB_XciM_LucasX]